MTFISDYLNLKVELNQEGVFDALLERDSNYFINIVKLRTTKIAEFENSYNKINKYFSDIAKLLNASKNKNDKFYKAALHKFKFSEFNGINLGFSKSSYGAAFGKQLREKVISDAYEIIKTGSIQPEIFHLVPLFEENVGPDRLSDMIGTIIKEDILKYTQSINQKLGVNACRYQQLRFSKRGLLFNPYKNCEIFYLPISLLSELPIAKSWEDLNDVISKNEAIKAEVNENIAKEWKKWSVTSRKEYLKNFIFKDPSRCARVVDAYRNTTVADLDYTADIDYCIEAIFRDNPLIITKKRQQLQNSLQVTLMIIDDLKKWVEYNGGCDIIKGFDTKKREKYVQRLIHLAAKRIIKTSNLDISFEPNAGRGPVDFKVSCGDDITIVEVKLSSNAQYIHGLTVQLEEYKKAEDAKNTVYVMFDLGNSVRIRRLKEVYQALLNKDSQCPKLIIINCSKKESASIYTKENIFD